MMMMMMMISPVGKKKYTERGGKSKSEDAHTSEERGPSFRSLCREIEIDGVNMKIKMMMMTIMAMMMIIQWHLGLVVSNLSPKSFSRFRLFEGGEVTLILTRSEKKLSLDPKGNFSETVKPRESESNDDEDDYDETDSIDWGDCTEDGERRMSMLDYRSHRSVRRKMNQSGFSDYQFWAAAPRGRGVPKDGVMWNLSFE